jgi:hemerythrin-like domain-containing protein
MKITDALVAEHTIFLTVFDQIERVLPSLTTQTEVGTMARIIEGLLKEHAARETSLAYLALDHILAEQGQMNRMHQDHHEIDARLKQVQVAKTCAEARRLLKASVIAAREHFRLEEKVIFPLLERVLHQDTLRELGRSWIERNLELAASRTM